jgi:hypothetical protein
MKMSLLFCTEFSIYVVFYLPKIGIGNEQINVHRWPNYYSNSSRIYYLFLESDLLNSVLVTRLFKDGAFGQPSGLDQIMQTTSSTIGPSVPKLYVQPDFSVAVGNNTPPPAAYPLPQLGDVIPPLTSDR